MEGGEEESRDRSVDREDRVSDRIGTGGGDMGAGISVCSRYWSRSSMVMEKNIHQNVGYMVSEGIRSTKVWKPWR